jgi:hypothetical protein
VNPAAHSLHHDQQSTHGLVNILKDSPVVSKRPSEVTPYVATIFLDCSRNALKVTIKKDNAMRIVEDII